MDTLFKTFLAIHIAGGTTALLSGLAAMLASKGKRLHRLAGTTYFWAMATVCASAVVLCVLHPQQFLFYVAIFSFYLCFSGKRITERKKPDAKPARQDWIAAGAAATAGAIMLVRGVFVIVQGVDFGLVSVVFGVLCIGISVRDMRAFMHPPQETLHWFFTHLSRMIGGYIATFTAFCVVNVKFLPALLVWLLPTVIGSVGIVWWTRYYRRKFQRR